MGKSFVLPFIKKEQVAKDTYSFYFDRSKVSFDFLPGQYVRLTLPHKNPDDRGTSRYFTISSSPLQKKILIITVRILESSFKKTLYNLQPGDKGHFFGPMGWFLLPKDEQVEKVFIAGGIGITPFHSLLTTLADQKLPAAITLFAAFSDVTETLFYEPLMELNKKHPQITVIFTFSNSQEFKNSVRGEKGRISRKLIKKYISEIYKPVYYIVGSESMVAGTKALLLDLGIAEEKIQTEDFTGY